MRQYQWHAIVDASIQLAELEPATKTSGFLIVEFPVPSEVPCFGWRMLEPWRRSRAVTIADIRCSLSGAALDVAINSDIVYMREGSFLELPGQNAIPSPHLIWAAGRAGRPALRRVLLGNQKNESKLDPHEAVALNLIAEALPPEDDLPLPDPASIPALTAARDLMRASGSGGHALEMATFQLLFAIGHPNEGALAFIERRPAHFNE